MYENKAGLGYQDFRRMREDHIVYIDKTDFIKEWWETGSEVTLITRPRRFAKNWKLIMSNGSFLRNYEGRETLLKGWSFLDRD